jgi:FkbM family methyltransferase
MIKKITKSLFRMLGYSLVKNIKPDPGEFSVVRVGRFDIRINNQSGLKYCYEHCRDYGAQLSKLTQVLKTHFSDLQVIDVGANQGDSVALIKSGADVPVISIEGDESLTDQFAKNTAQFKNITLIKTFLSEDTEELDCEHAHVGHNLTLTPTQNSSKSRLTKFMNIDMLYANSVLNDHCKLLKIDTEGFDLKIIRGAGDFIRHIKPVILFELNRENLAVTEKDPFSIFHWLLDQSYDTVLFYESDGRFMFSSNLDNHTFLRQIYDYADGYHAKIRYLDIVAFHKDDDRLAGEYINFEEIHRLKHHA